MRVGKSASGARQRAVRVSGQQWAAVARPASVMCVVYRLPGTLRTWYTGIMVPGISHRRIYAFDV